MRSSFESTQRLLDLHRGALQRRYPDVDLDRILRALRRGGDAEEPEATDNRGAEERAKDTEILGNGKFIAQITDR